MKARIPRCSASLGLLTVLLAAVECGRRPRSFSPVDSVAFGSANVNGGPREKEGFSNLRKWTHSSWLGKPLRSPRLSWRPNDEFVDFGVEANTVGGIIIGFNNEDFVILWVDDFTNGPHVEDCHFGNGSRILFKDEKKSYHLIGGEQNATHTKIAFRRLWNTCDSNDSVLGADTVLITWSIHPNDEVDTDLSEFYSEEKSGTFRGEKYLLLQVPTQSNIPRAPGVREWDVLMRNVLVKKKAGSHYWCKVFRTPSLPKKNHIVAYEPMILCNKTNAIRHMFLYECDVPPGFLDSYASSNQNGYPCYTEEMPDDWANCITPVAVWVAGGEGKILPDHIGIPVGPRQTYFMLEIRYDDDPGTLPLMDNSGFRLYHTEELRFFDAGIMTTGVEVTPLHLIPPRQSEYRSVGLCNDVCTNKLFPLMGIKVVSVLLHSHIPASSVKLRHVRGNDEMNPIAENNRYEFTYQVDQTLKKEVTVFPSDHLITECNYSTVYVTAPTIGAPLPKEETCSSFVTYYPKRNVSSCRSMTPVRHFFKILGIKSFFNVTVDEIDDFVMATASRAAHKFPAIPVPGNGDGRLLRKWLANFSQEHGLPELIISEPNEFKGKSLRGYVESLPWTDASFTKSFESSLARGLQIVLCRTRSGQLAVAPDIESFPNFTEMEKSSKALHECQISSNLKGNSGERNFSFEIVLLAALFQAAATFLAIL